MALAGTAAHVERVVRAWRRTDRAAEQEEDRERQAERTLRTWVDDDGMVVVRGRLTPEAGSAFRRALEAAVASFALPEPVPPALSRLCPLRSAAREASTTAVGGATRSPSARLSRGLGPRSGEVRAARLPSLVL